MYHFQLYPHRLRPSLGSFFSILFTQLPGLFWAFVSPCSTVSKQASIYHILEKPPLHPFVACFLLCKLPTIFSTELVISPQSFLKQPELVGHVFRLSMVFTLFFQVCYPMTFFFSRRVSTTWICYARSSQVDGIFFPPQPSPLCDRPLG